MFKTGRVLPALVLVVFAAVLGYFFYYLSNTKDETGEIVIALPLEPSSLDPRSNPSASIAQISLYNIYETLVKRDATGAIVPSLAKSWKVSNDSLVWDFYLKEATFHNGVNFSSKDVVWTFNENKKDSQGNPRKKFFRNMKSVEAIASDHVRITLNEHKNEFLHGLSVASAVVVEESSAGENKTNPIGTGPYRFVERKEGDSIILEKSPYFEGNLGFNRVVQKFYRDEAPKIAALKSGDLHYSAYVNPEYVSFFETSDEFNLMEGSTYGEVIVALNNRNPVLASQEVRRAMQMAIDRESLLEVVMQGYGDTMGSHYTSLQDFYVDTRGVLPYDLAKAKSVMDRFMGKEGIEEVRLNMLIPDVFYARKSSQVVAEMLSKVGVEVSVEVLDWPRWVREVYREKKYDMTIIAHVEYMDILNYARPNYYWGYDNSGFRSLASNIERERDLELYKAYLESAQSKIAREVPNLFLFELPRLSVSAKGIDGANADDHVFAVEVANLVHR